MKFLGKQFPFLRGGLWVTWQRTAITEALRTDRKWTQLPGEAFRFARIVSKEAEVHR